jgi:uncharacterized protein (TIGR03000 family)
VIYGSPAVGIVAAAQRVSRVPETIQGTPQKASADNRATILVSLPADATLTFDGQPTASSSGTRWFVSPPLQQGSNYNYQLRAEVVRGGVPRVLTRTITVRANEETRVSMDFSNTDVATGR